MSEDPIRYYTSWHASGRTPLMVQFTKDIDTQNMQGHDYHLMRRRYSAEGQDLCDHLIRHLPGGLIDALFGALCAYKASVFVVSHVEPEEGK